MDRRSIVLGVLLGAANAAVARTTFTDFGAWRAAAGGSRATINFEDLPPNTGVTTQYGARVPVGVHFRSVGGRLEIADRVEIANETGGSPVSGNQALDEEGNDVNSIVASLVLSGTNTPTGVRAVGGWMIDLSTFGPGVVEFRGLGGALVDRIVAGPPAEGNQFFGIVSNVPIASVSFDGQNTEEYVLIDDFVYTPAPGAAPAFIAGALALSRRRR